MSSTGAAQEQHREQQEQHKQHCRHLHEQTERHDEQHHPDVEAEE